MASRQKGKLVLLTLLLLRFFEASGLLGEIYDGQCLQETQALLGSVADTTVVLEVATWDSHRLATAIVAILLKEVFGYRVAFNHVHSTTEAFYRAAAPTNLKSIDALSEAGSTLKQMKRSSDFVYVNLEVWPSGKDDSPAVDGNVVSLSSIGYSGRSGWYTQYRNDDYRETHYKSYDFESQANGKLRNLFSNATQHPCACVWDAPKTAFERQAAGCTNICHRPFSGTTATLAVLNGYDAGLQEEIVRNNNLTIKTRYYNASSYESEVESLLLANEPLLFYYWTPTPFLERLNRGSQPPARLFLPATQCGRHEADGSGTWRCDYNHEQLLKIASSNCRTVAPMLFTFLKSFTLSPKDTYGRPSNISLADATISRLFSALEARAKGAQQPLSENELKSHIFGVACDWVKDNRHQGAEWSQWSRPVPAWGDTTTPFWLTVNTFVYVCAVICIVVLLETGCLRSTLFPCHRRCTKSVVNSKPPSRNDQPANEQTDPFVNLTSSDVKRNVSNAYNESLHKDVKLHSISTTTKQSSCVVSWSSCHYYALEGEAAMRCSAQRMGDVSGPCSLRFRTHDSNGIEGIDYDHVDAEVVFASDQTHADVMIPLISREAAWDPDRHFHVELYQSPEQSQMITLATPCFAIATIVNVDMFPGSSWMTHRWFRRCSERMPSMTTMAYVADSYKEKRKWFWITVVCYVFVAVDKVATTALIPKLVVDTAITRSGSVVSRSYEMSLLLGILFLGSTAVRRIAERTARITRHSAGLRASLAEKVFRKFWSLGEEQHLELGGVVWLLATIEQPEKIVELGWNHVFSLIQEIAGLFVSVFVVMMFATDYFSPPFEFILFVPVLCLLCVFPLSFYIVMIVRGPAYQQMIKRQLEEKEEVLNIMEWSINSWSLYCSYGSRVPKRLNQQLKRFLDVNALYRDTSKSVGLFVVDTIWIPRWLSSLITAGFVGFGGFSMVEKHLFGQGYITVGSYMAMISIFINFGNSMTNISAYLEGLDLAGVHIQSLQKLLHMDGSAVQRRRVTLEELQKEELQRSVQSSFAFEDVTFRYAKTSNVGNAETILQNASFTLPLGGIIMVRGHRGVGKRTFLKLLSGVVLPSTGVFRFPLHAHVVLLNQQPFISPWLNAAENMMLCAQEWVTMQMAEALFKALRLRWPMSKACAGIRLIDAVLVNVGRALLADPDVLILDQARWPSGNWKREVVHILQLWQTDGLLGVMRGIFGVDADDDQVLGMFPPEIACPKISPRTLVFSQNDWDPNLFLVDRVVDMQVRESDEQVELRVLTGEEIRRVDLEASKKKALSSLDLDVDHDGVLTREEFLRAGSNRERVAYI